MRLVGSDLYSTALTGQVATDGFDSSRNTYFAIVSTGARGVLYVACESSTTDVIDDNTLVVRKKNSFNFYIHSRSVACVV